MSIDNMALRVANALKPPRCPNCGAEIKYLVFHWCTRKTIESFNVSIDKNGELDYDRVDTFDEEEDLEEYSCPDCGITLFNKEPDVEAFLKGELEWKKESPTSR